MSELAEGARLEIVCAVNRGAEGSNPSLSAITEKANNQIRNFGTLHFDQKEVYNYSSSIRCVKYSAPICNRDKS